MRRRHSISRLRSLGTRVSRLAFRWLAGTQGLGKRRMGLQVVRDVTAHVLGVPWLERRKTLLVVGA